MKVRDFMRHNPPILNESDKLEKAVEIFIANKIDGLPVLSTSGLVLGIITRSHTFKVLAKGISPDTHITAFMEKNPITIDPDDQVSKLITIPVSTLPVVENQRFIGLVTLSDTIRAYYSSALHLKEELNTLINSVHNGIISIDSQGIVKTFNPAAEKALGISKDEIIGNPVQEILPENTLIEIITSGNHESGTKTYNGKTYLSNRTPVVNDNIVIGAVEVIQDLSDLEAISQELIYTKDLKERLNAIINSSFDGILVTDSEGDIMKSNEAFLKTFGFKSNDDLLGKNIKKVLGDTFNDSLLHRVVINKEAITLSHKVENGNNVLITANPVTSEKGILLGIVANVRDITELNNLKEQISSLNQHFNHELRKYKLSDKFIFKSPKSLDLIDLVLRVAEVDSTVLIQGESGVGKEIITQILHSNSSRARKPLVRINCGAIPGNLLESELFGYEEGAFSGAKKGGKMGLFEVANEGTLLLDEIAELPLILQVKLLRAIQEGEIIRVGGVQPQKINVRIVAATNRNLMEMVSRGDFREDLYYRLNVVPVYVPPLRERKEEIPALVNCFLDKFNTKYNMTKVLAQTLIDEFIDYDWPGNIRELENVVERAIVTSPNQVITQVKLSNNKYLKDHTEPKILTDFDGKNLKDIVQRFEKELLVKAINKYGTTRKTAAELGVAQSTIVRKAARYGIVLKDA